MAAEDQEDIGLFDVDGRLTFQKTRSRSTPPERFWRYVQIVGHCWEWTGGTMRAGYGHWQYRTGSGHFRQMGAHRFSWEMLYGPIPGGLHVCHSCDNPKCVRPTHLWLGTDRDNAQDKMQKGRDNLAARVWPMHRRGVKIEWETAQTIRQRRLAGERVDHLAAEYGVSRATIYLISVNRRWREN